MKKNDIILFLLMALPTLLLTSCLKDQEDVFEESASARTANYLSNTKKVLTSAENGWLLNYYPDRDQSYGGTPYVLKFSDETVEVSSELAGDPTYSVESTYVLRNEDGPVLMFDTYNELMHYFATPSGSSGAGGYEAYDGDFIFIILGISADQDTITLKGSRSGNVMYMYRLPGSGVDYLSKVLETEETMPVNYTFNVQDEIVNVTLSGGTASFISPSKKVNELMAYIYTDRGIEFYEPVDIYGTVLNGIVNSGEAEVTSSIGDSPVLMKVVFLPINEIFVNTDWYLSYANLGEFAKPYFDKAIAGSASEGEIISMMAFTLINGNFSLYFLSGKYPGALAFSTEYIGEDQIRLTYNPANNYSNGNWYYKNAGYNNLLVPLERTFRLESNSKIRPTVVRMVDTEEPTNVITVTTSAASF